jgi:hypothetical protein
MPTTVSERNPAPAAAATPSARDVFGAEIQYFRLDPRYWDTVLARFQDAGLRCVTTYVQWGTHLVGPPDRQHPAGVLDFEGRTDPRRNLRRFLEAVERRGLLLNFRCGPFCCNEMPYGGYPRWLVMDHPRMMAWDWQNRLTQGYWIARKEGSQPSYLHPEYLAWCEKWLAEVGRMIVPHLHTRGGCVTMVNLDNEISYIVRDSFLDSDYNPANVQPGGFWHQFLLEKYGRAARLPYAARYRTLDAVPAPRAVPATIAPDELPWYLDWAEFKTWCMTGYIRRLRAMHEANGVRGVTFMTNFNPHRPEGVPTRMPAFQEAVGPGGIVGYDFYRGVFMSYSGYHSMARVLKLMNASVRYTWSAEFMAGTWNKDLTKVGRVSDEHTRFMTRCALAHGCRAIAWFMFHDRDCWGDGPVSSHGHARPNLAVLRETPDLLFRRMRNWDALRPQADVAVIYDLAQHLHTYLGDPMPCADNDLHIGKPVIAGVEAGRASAEYEGLFRLVEQAGAQAAAVDIVHDPAALGRYPLAFMPGGAFIEPAARAALRRYVRGGGVLVVSGPVPQPFLAPGSFVHLRAWIGQAKPEEDALAAIASVARLIRRHVPRLHVHVRPETEMTWVDWAPGGGLGDYGQPRTLASAVLHRGAAGERVLFVLNHYPEAARLVVTFGRDRVARIVDLDTGEAHPAARNRVTLDLDRKCARVYRVEGVPAPRRARPLRMARAGETRRKRQAT